jgi:hypothetical protein
MLPKKPRATSTTAHPRPVLLSQLERGEQRAAYCLQPSARAQAARSDCSEQPAEAPALRAALALSAHLRELTVPERPTLH